MSGAGRRTGFHASGRCRHACHLAASLRRLRHPAARAGSDRAAVIRDIARAVVDRGRGQPVAVFIDDAHLLDDASAALTYQLAASRSILLIATARTGAPPSDSVLALWKDGLAERFELGPLSLADVEDLLAVALTGPTDTATARLLGCR